MRTITPRTLKTLQVLPNGVCTRISFFVSKTVREIRAFFLSATKIQLKRVILSRIAGAGELFSSDFQACAQSPRWATRCSLGSVRCSCDAAPRTAVRKRALLVASSPLSEQQKTWSIFAKQIEIFPVKAWLATFKARNANLNLLDDVEKKKKNSIDLQRAFTSTSVGRSSIFSASVAAGLFPNLSCLVSLNF